MGLRGSGGSWNRVLLVLEHPLPRCGCTEVQHRPWWPVGLCAGGQGGRKERRERDGGRKGGMGRGDVQVGSAFRSPARSGPSSPSCSAAHISPALSRWSVSSERTQGCTIFPATFVPEEPVPHRAAGSRFPATEASPLLPREVPALEPPLAFPNIQAGDGCSDELRREPETRSFGGLRGGVCRRRAPVCPPQRCHAGTASVPSGGCSLSPPPPLTSPSLVSHGVVFCFISPPPPEPWIIPPAPPTRSRALGFLLRHPGWDEI